MLWGSMCSRLAVIFDFLLDSVLIVGVGFKGVSVLYNAAEGFGGSGTNIPGSMAKVRYDAGEKIEQFIGMGLLYITELLRRCIPDELCTAGFK